jgi:hypothetical protein
MHDNRKHLSRRQVLGALTGAVYSQGVYASRGANFTRSSGDNVFSDGTANEMAAITGSPSSGYTATLQIGVWSRRPVRVGYDAGTMCSGHIAGAGR